MLIPKILSSRFKKKRVFYLTVLAAAGLTTGLTSSANVFVIFHVAALLALADVLAATNVLTTLLTLLAGLTATG